MILKPPKGAMLNRGHPLSRGLVGCWLMNEGGGNKVYDLSGNGNIGTFVGSGLLWTPAQFGPGLSFSNANYEYVSISKLTIPATMDKTFSFWVKPKALAEADFLFDCTSRLVLALRDVGSIDTIAFYDGAWHETGVAADLNTWQSIIFSFSGITARVYKNGINIGGTIAYTQKAVDANVRLGNSVSNTHNCNSLIDYVQIWNRALTASEILSLYREPFQMFGVDL